MIAHGRALGDDSPFSWGWEELCQMTVLPGSLHQEEGRARWQRKDRAQALLSKGDELELRS